MIVRLQALLVLPCFAIIEHWVIAAAFQQGNLSVRYTEDDAELKDSIAWLSSGLVFTGVKCPLEGQAWRRVLVTLHK